jgi:hypothetical protein
MSNAGGDGARHPAGWPRLPAPGSPPGDVIDSSPRQLPAWLRGPALTAAVVVILAATAIIAAVTRAPGPSVRDRHWRRDIEVLARQLPQVHADGLTHVTPAAWHAAAARLEARVPQLTDGQVLAGLAAMVALLHDDETQLQLPPSSLYPFAVRWIGTSLYLTLVPPADRRLLGARLIAVDGHSIAQVEARLREVIDYQDPGMARAWMAGFDQSAGDLNDADLMSWLGLARSPGGALLTVRLARGGLGRVWMPAADLADDPIPAVATIPAAFYQQQPTRPFWLRVLRRRHAVYLRYSQCLDNDGFQRLTARAMTVLHAHPGWRLIVDLRGNPGGTSTPFQLLLNDIQHDAALDRRGHVLGLIDGLTESAATQDAGQLRSDTRGLLVGEEVADPVDEFGNPGLLHLPYFDVQVQYATAALNPGRAREGVPDIAVTPTVHDLPTGADPVLATALKYARHSARRGG